MRQLVAALAIVLLCAGGAQAAVESDLVKAGMAAFDDLDYQKSIDLLHKALNETLTKEERVATYRTLAFAHVAIDRPREAQEDFENLLRTDPSFQLDRTISPRVRSVFEAAQAKVAVTGLPEGNRSPGLNAEVPRATRYGRPVTIRVNYPGGVASKMELFYRTRGDRKFSRLEVRGSEGMFNATVPGMHVQAPALEYYLTLVDDSGAGAAWAGSLGKPLAVDVEGPKKPVYAKAWFWGVIGGVAVAGAVAGVLAATLPNHIGPNTPATLTIQPQ